MKKSLKNFLILTVLGLFIANPAFAIGNKYANNLLKVDFNKNSDGSVNVNLYASNSFKVKPNVIKRNNNLYVIILPETYHSITSSPSLKKVSGDLESADVKLFPYTNIQSNNGYTKITIQTKTEPNFKIDTNIVKPKTEIDPEIKTIIANNKTKVVKQQTLTNKTVSNKETITPKSPKVQIAQKPHKEIAENNINESIAQSNDLTTQNSEQLNVSSETPAEKEVQQEITPPVEVIKVPAKQNFVKNHKKLLYGIGISGVVVPLLLFLLMMKFISKVNKKRFEENLEPTDDKFTINDLKQQLGQEVYKPMFEEEEGNISENEDVNIEELDELYEQYQTPELTDDDIKEFQVLQYEQEEPQQPVVLAEAEIAEGHGFYLIQFGFQISLMYVNGAEVTVLNQFDKIKKARILMKKYSEKGNTQTYMLRVDKWQALIDVKEETANLAITF